MRRKSLPQVPAVLFVVFSLVVSPQILLADTAGRSQDTGSTRELDWLDLWSRALTAFGLLDESGPATASVESGQVNAPSDEETDYSALIDPTG